MIHNYVINVNDIKLQESINNSSNNIERRFKNKSGNTKSTMHYYRNNRSYNISL